MIKGVAYSITASFLFGVVYYLSTVLQPLTGAELFGWRILVTLPFIIGLLFLIKQQRHFVDFLIRIKNEPHLIAVLLFTSSNMGIQLWLFLWAPVNGKAIEVSIGYLLLPLMMVLIGRLIFKERISKIKAFAIAFATVGVLSKVVITGAFSWETLLVCSGYPIYFAVRKYFSILHLSSFTLEMTLLVPISLYFATQSDMVTAQLTNPNIYWLLILLGVVSGVALSLYILSSQVLPINLLGLLGYLEPFVMLVVAFVIGETLEPNSYVLIITLMISISLLIFEGIAIGKLRKKSY